MCAFLPIQTAAWPCLSQEASPMCVHAAAAETQSPGIQHKGPEKKLTLWAILIKSWPC